MRVSSGYCKLSEPVSYLDNLSVEGNKVINAVDPALVYHKLVIAERLDLKIIIERCDAFELFIGCTVFNSLIYLAGFACAAYDKPLSVSLQHGSWQSRSLVEVVNVRQADELVYILYSLLVLSQKDYVICPVFLDIKSSVFEPRILIRIQVAFHTVYDLDILACFGQLACSLGSIRESLNHAMVCDGDCRLSPVGSCIYDVSNFIESVIVAHLGVAVKLDSSSVRISILLESLRYLLESIGHHQILMLICVIFDRASRTDHVA